MHRHSRQLGISIICRRNLNDVSTNKIESIKTADDCPEFTSCPATGFGGASSGGNFDSLSVNLTLRGPCVMTYKQDQEYQCRWIGKQD